MEPIDPVLAILCSSDQLVVSLQIGVLPCQLTAVAALQALDGGVGDGGWSALVQMRKIEDWRLRVRSGWPLPMLLQETRGLLVQLFEIGLRHLEVELA